MHRRGFLARLFAAPIVALALLKAPVFEASEALPVFPAEDIGISIRFIQSFDATGAQHVNHFDVLYGFGNLTPDFAVRVENEPAPWWSLSRWFAA